MKRTAIAVSASCLAAAFALGACGSDEEPAEEETTDRPAVETTPGEETTESSDDQAAVPELLDFTSTTIDGESFEGASLVGDPTVLWFWEHDCPICQSQGPTVSGLFDQYGDQVDIVGVSGPGLYAASGDDDRHGFVDQTGTGDIVHIEDEDYTLRTSFDVFTQSTFVVMDADGTVVESGSLSADDLNAAVDSTL